MAYREVGMWEILEVLRRVHRGESQVAIARATGHTRKTIRRYMRTACQWGWVPGGSPEPDEALARAVAERLRPVAEEAPSGESEARLRPHRERIEAWLRPEGGGRGLRLSKVHALLEREGVRVPYSSLHRFATRHCGFQDRCRLTVRVAEVAPGELAEVDFGRLGRVWDPEAGSRHGRGQGAQRPPPRPRPAPAPAEPPVAVTPRRRARAPDAASPKRGGPRAGPTAGRSPPTRAPSTPPPSSDSSSSRRVTLSSRARARLPSRWSSWSRIPRPSSPGTTTAPTSSRIRPFTLNRANALASHTPPEGLAPWPSPPARFGVSRKSRPVRRKRAINSHDER